MLAVTLIGYGAIGQSICKRLHAGTLVRVTHVVVRIHMPDSTASCCARHCVMMCEMAGHSADCSTFQAAARKDGR